MDSETQDSLFAILLMTPASALVEAWVLFKLWGWFAVPLGAPDASPAVLFGLACMISVVTYRASITTKDASPSGMLLESIAAKFILLGFGFIAHIAAAGF